MDGDIDIRDGINVDGGIDIHGRNIRLATDIYKHSSKLLTKVLVMM